MAENVTLEMVRSAAQMIDLPLTETEIEPVRERLQILVDAAAQVEHLADDTGHIDARFDARWEIEQA